ncbi:hypothetical protein A2272_02850 [Candidatus Peregrinibacteria bacterium RIFOXYA12_FULL_33_12]|nr:MAG: hypothetical protein A2272_02850 [Candidatus Peregrinibacteria bacterium RIFOXYA12_FULL_33_12]
MKKLILGLLLILVVNILGCNTNKAQTTEIVEANEEENINAVTEKNYSLWAITGDSLIYNIWNQVNESKNGKDMDCVDVINGDTGGGDLLSTLIVNDEARAKLNLNIYTKDYLKNLEVNVVNFTISEYDSDFYAFNICNLADDIDVIAGYRYPKNKNSKVTETQTTYPKGSSIGDENEDFKDKPILIVKNKENIFAYENIKLLDNTATGAEVTPCQASIEGENIKWSCFESMYRENGELKGSNIKYWLIPLDGGSPEEKTEIEYN